MHYFISLWHASASDKDFQLAFNPKKLGFLLPVQHWGGGVFFIPLCKIRSRRPRDLKFSGLIGYIVLYKIC